MHELALFAGSAAAAIFMISQLPMLVKAFRTKNLASYSFANIGLANLGNVLYAFYVVQVPIGPAWAVHGFNVATSGLMLFWYLRYRWRTLDHLSRESRGQAPRQLDPMSADPQLIEESNRSLSQQHSSRTLSERDQVPPGSIQRTKAAALVEGVPGCLCLSCSPG